MTLCLEVHVDASQAARHLAGLIAERARKSVEIRGTFTFAVSRGAELVARLSEENVPWPYVTVFQVDERVAPSDHEDRNLTQLFAALPIDAIRPMPVEDPDLEAAAARYANSLPQALDLVHLGLGRDGHTASLVPGDPVLDVRDRPVAVTAEHRGRRRMTLTYPALDGAREIMWLVTGERKRDALARLLESDPSIPAARVVNVRQRIVADRTAAQRR
ncbi:MAG: 6-phosphogluconolactonase [Actinomycetota bacterium]|nr:6-phosphogluconolactonase [Actinomycetota bacterium]